MAYALASAAAAFVLAVALGPAVIAFLRSRRFGKEIRPEGPETHFGKSGTPTMGGIMVIIPVVATTLILNAG